MNTTDTIRLSDRVELRPTGTGSFVLWRDELLVTVLGATTSDALIALANPPRYDLPPGVIHGSDGRFYAPGDVVRTLPDEMWERFHVGAWMTDDPNRDAIPTATYQVRPTAANPLQPLPPFTFPLPDGTLACFRRDAAKLREAGAVLLYTASGNPSSDQVLRVEFPPTPKTERVALHELIGRTFPGISEPIAHWDFDTQNEFGNAYWSGGHGRFTIDANGTVEVLLTDTER